MSGTHEVLRKHALNFVEDPDLRCVLGEMLDTTLSSQYVEVCGFKQ